MTLAPGRRLAAGIAWVALAAGGCGLGPGERSEGEATLLVTRGHGSERVAQASVADPTASETVLRLLDRELEIETRYGGGFVQSIEGLDGGVADGRSVDWFFFVNGVESGRGAAEVEVEGGDRIWWDLRDWTDAMRAPAVVGSFPEPFAQASTEAAERLPVRVECREARALCELVAGRLAEEGVDAAIARPVRASAPALRVLVGRWRRLEGYPEAKLLADGPGASGVFARVAASGRSLSALDVRASVARELGAGTGLVAAVRYGEAPPSWLVTGPDARGVRAAAGAIEAADLAQRYAVAVLPGGETLPLPLPAEAGS